MFWFSSYFVVFLLSSVSLCTRLSFSFIVSRSFPFYSIRIWQRQHRTHHFMKVCAEFQITFFFISSLLCSQIYLATASHTDTKSHSVHWISEAFFSRFFVFSLLSMIFCVFSLIVFRFLCVCIASLWVEIHLRILFFFPNFAQTVLCISQRLRLKAAI